MATAPNLNPNPLSPQTGIPAGIDGMLGELFASLMPVQAGEGVVTGPPMPGQPVAGAPLPDIDIRAAGVPLAESEAGDTPDAEGGPEGADETISTLLAQAEFVPFIQPQPAPPPVAITSTVAVAAAPAPAVAAQAPVVAAPAPAQPAADAPAPGQVAPQGEPVTPELAAAIRQAAAAMNAAAPRQAKAGARGAETPPEMAARSALPDVVALTELPPAAEPGPDDAKPIGPTVSERAAAAPPQAAPSVPAPASVAPSFDPSTPLQAAPAERAAAPQPAPSADQAIERELDLAHDSEWLDRLARDIARTGNADTPLRFKLHPHTLGHLQVELTQGDRGTSVRLTVDTEAARALIADAQPRLAAEARAQGVRLAHTEVDLSGSGHQAASGDSRRQEEARQPQFIRTARDAALPADEANPRASVRTDRYA